MTPPPANRWAAKQVHVVGLLLAGDLLAMGAIVSLGLDGMT
jgi:hypothetical protein